MRLERPETKFPVYLDSPPMFLFWEMDECLPMAVSVIIFLPTRKLWLGLIIGYILFRVYRVYKKKFYSNFLYHLLWIFGIWTPKGARKGYITKLRES